MKVEKGDLVKVHIVNASNAIHPMHFHGHTFQVLTQNGKELTGIPVYMDTINVLPGESYDIAFKANNPGLWMFHCHDLHHAAAGMDTMVDYHTGGGMITFDLEEFVEEIHKRGIRPRGRDMGRDIHAALFEEIMCNSLLFWKPASSSNRQEKQGQPRHPPRPKWVVH